jgi:hypothetical protein
MYSANVDPTILLRANLSFTTTGSRPTRSSVAGCCTSRKITTSVQISSLTIGFSEEAAGSNDTR